MSKIRGKGLLGVKVGMTSIFDAAGDQVPVTVVRAGPNFVVGLTKNGDGKTVGLRLGFGERREKLVTKPERVVYQKAGIKPPRFVRQFCLEAKDAEGLAPGTSLGVDVFTVGQWLDVTGTSNGKGFAGVVKRHKMSGMGARGSHGVHEYHRHIGAIGMRKTPGRVFPGKRMPGHMGMDRVTVQNLRVVAMDVQKQLLMISGAIPGHEDGLLLLRPAVKPPRVKKVEVEKKPVNPMKAAKKSAQA